MSCTAGLTSAEADMSTMSESVDGPRNMLKKLSNTSEHERKHSERSRRRNSPGRPREEPDETGGEMAIPGGAHDVQELPWMVRNERADEADAPG